MSDEKNVLVLFYDKKDREHLVEVNGRKRTLEEEIVCGFEGTNVNYKIRTASPRHDSWMVLEYFNEHRYDGIIIVAGLSCSFDMPGYLMETLADNQKIHIQPRDWQKVELTRPGPDGKTEKYTVSINHTIESKYFHRHRTVPIIGVPVYDPITAGDTAFSSMLMASRPSDAACVPIGHARQAAQLTARLLTTPWREVKILVPDTRVIEYDQETGRPKICSPGFQVGRDIGNLLDEAFTPFEDDKIPFGYQNYDDYIRELMKPDFVLKKADQNVLHVCVYDRLAQIQEMSKLTDLIIGVCIPAPGRVDMYGFNDVVSHGLENVIHSRIGVGDNATMLVAHALYASHPKLEPARFTTLRRLKRMPNFLDCLQIMQEQGISFEVNAA
jgi:phosphoribosylcarboxyaminoimidazole (NCAIR) mutase